MTRRNLLAVLLAPLFAPFVKMVRGATPVVATQKPTIVNPFASNAGWTQEEWFGYCDMPGGWTRTFETGDYGYSRELWQAIRERTAILRWNERHSVKIEEILKSIEQTDGWLAANRARESFLSGQWHIYPCEWSS